MNQPVPTGEQSSIPEMSEVVLEVRNLTKHFPVGSFFRPKTVKALNDVSFTISRGQVVALVGESGSGKSTTARLISRLMPPTSGEIILRGKNVLKTEPVHPSLSYRKEIQMIFQDPFGSLNPVHTIGHHIERPLAIHKMVRPSKSLERVHELLETVGLTPPDEAARKYPYQMSGGQRQRVAIARALAVEPEIILADEPISMLDVSIRMGVLNLMEQLKEERGIGFLYITHDLASARYIGDRTMVMYTGYVVEAAESRELMEQPAHPYTQMLMNAIPNPAGGLLRKKAEARGEIPSLTDLPPGCPFATRCPKVLEICKNVMPEKEYLKQDRDHWVRCHLYGSGQEPTPATIF
ncbi:MAG: ABC transporter ATP-binding protein [Chloroflexi bacterium]|nr:ABC transporter ATP-binding protein [Chloroflexota bacterium]OJV88346.1 MAG: ABC transporter ATP-binding protein [Chloroflexi bacterium 54-19]